MYTNFRHTLKKITMEYLQRLERLSNFKNLQAKIEQASWLLISSKDNTLHKIKTMGCGTDFKSI